MASGPITSWQIDGETMEKVTDFIFLGSKITADGDDSHEIKTCLLLGRKAMINLDSILKSRDITFPTKVHLVKDMVFPVVMYVCESWTINKAEHQRIDAFELWYWRRLLRVPWTARRSNQSVQKEINPKYSLEGLLLKLQYFGHLIQRADTSENKMLEDREAWCAAGHGGEVDTMEKLTPVFLPGESHGLQHTGLPCLPVCLNSRPLSWGYSLTISPSATFFSF